MINSETKRINHVFGGPCKASVITNERYYYHVYKYVLRNPVDAGIAKDCFSYEYSTLKNSLELPIVRPDNAIDALVPYEGIKDWLHEGYEVEKSSIGRGLSRTVFKYVLE